MGDIPREMEFRQYRHGKRSYAPLLSKEQWDELHPVLFALHTENVTHERMVEWLEAHHEIRLNRERIGHRMRLWEHYVHQQGRTSHRYEHQSISPIEFQDQDPLKEQFLRYLQQMSKGLETVDSLKDHLMGEFLLAMNMRNVAFGYFATALQSQTQVGDAKHAQMICGLFQTASDKSQVQHLRYRLTKSLYEYETASNRDTSMLSAQNLIATLYRHAFQATSSHECLLPCLDGKIPSSRIRLSKLTMFCGYTVTSGHLARTVPPFEGTATASPMVTLPDVTTQSEEFLKALFTWTISTLSRLAWGHDPTSAYLLRLLNAGSATRYYRSLATYLWQEYMREKFSASTKKGSFLDGSTCDPVAPRDRLSIESLVFQAFLAIEKFLVRSFEQDFREAFLKLCSCDIITVDFPSWVCKRYGSGQMHSSGAIETILEFFMKLTRVGLEGRPNNFDYSDALWCLLTDIVRVSAHDYEDFFPLAGDAMAASKTTSEMTTNNTPNKFDWMDVENDIRHLSHEYLEMMEPVSDKIILSQQEISEQDQVVHTPRPVDLFRELLHNDGWLWEGTRQASWRKPTSIISSHESRKFHVVTGMPSNPSVMGSSEISDTHSVLSL